MAALLILLAAVLLLAAHGLAVLVRSWADQRRRARLGGPDNQSARTLMAEIEEWMKQQL